MKPLLISTACALALASSAVAEELSVALPVFIGNGDPQRQIGNSSAPMVYLVFDTLIERDPYAVPVEFEPGLAVEWAQIEPTVWELKLREDVTMHDGTTFDAYDVEFTLDRIIRHENPEFTNAWGRYYYNFERVEVVDPLTVRIHTLREEPLFEHLVSARAAGITSKEHYEALGYADGALQPIGTGPYIVTEFRAGDSAVLERFDAFWGEPAPLDRVELRRVPEVASRVAGLVSGEFDVISNIPPDQEAALAVEGIKSVGVNWAMFHVWIIDMTDEVTGDARVRKALRLCTDRQALIDGLWNGKAHLPRAHQYEEIGAPFYMPDLELIRHDPDEARDLLADAGYDGEEIVAQFTQNYYLYGNLAAQVIQQQWRECGINLKLEEVEQIDNNALDLRAWSNPMHYPDPMGGFDVHWSATGWPALAELWQPTHPEWDATYDLARYGGDAETRRTAYRELLEIAEEESGWILLYEPYEVYGMRDDISFEIFKAHRPYFLPFRAGQIAIGEN